VREKEFAQDDDMVFTACREAVAYLGWKIADIDTNESRFTALTPASWRSFGDAVEIQVSDETDGTIVTASSEPRFSLINWGKDRTNEGIFLEKLAQEIHRRIAH